MTRVRTFNLSYTYNLLRFTINPGACEPIAPVAEMFYNNGSPAKIGMEIWQLLPFSRGSVSITVRLSSSAQVMPSSHHTLHCSPVTRSRSLKRMSTTSQSTLTCRFRSVLHE